MTAINPRVRTRLPVCLLLVLALASQAFGQTAQAPAGPSNEKVNDAIERGVQYLLQTQEVDGSWDGARFSAAKKFPTGTTALCLYTLLKCGLGSDHPAVQRGLSFLRHRRPQMHYSAGVTLMLYRALPASMRPNQTIKDLTKFLLAGVKGGRWAYPGYGPVDLSNTQYAMLGLRAASEMGQKLPARLWTDVATPLLDLQGNYGGWGYQKGSPTASMTTAGMAVLVICRDGMGTRGRGARAIQPKIKGALSRADMWLRDHWSVTRNTSVPQTGGPDTWFYYYLYGLERVGSFLRKEILGEHAWYPEGAEVLVKRQGKDGGWHIGGKSMLGDVNTCFALLFLRRGSRSTPSTAPVSTAAASTTGGAFEVGVTYGRPSHFFVKKLRMVAEKHLADGLKIHSVMWVVDGAEVGLVRPAPRSGGKGRDLFDFEHTFARNGTYKVEAVMRFSVDTETDPSEEEGSNTAQVVVHDVLSAIDREALDDAGRNRLAGVAHEVTTSSNGQAAELMLDGGYTTAWWSDASDGAPWVDLVLKKALKADCLKFGVALSADHGHNARPKEIHVRINNGRTIKYNCLDDRAKQTITFSRRAVKRIRIKVISRYPGAKSTQLGFREIELFKSGR